MGFSISISLSVFLCETTGKLFYYGAKSEKIYELPNIVVPNYCRRFVYETNNIYEMYRLDEQQEYVDINSLLVRFPSWKEVKNKYPTAEADFGWTEGDHWAFRTALQWFQSAQMPYMVYWG